MRATLLVASLLGLASLLPAQEEARARTLWDTWPANRVSPADPWAMKHRELRAALDELQVRHPGQITLVEEGRSAEGRAIPLLRIGSGPTPVLLWSQMHGDEPTATAALLDLFEWLGAHPGDPLVRAIQSRLTLWVIPMLNPDGAQRTQRWNAQGLDLNRDALRLASPEGRFLKAVRDRVKPVFGFNLHNQNPLLLAGRAGQQVALSLLAVPGDEACTETPGVHRVRQLAVTVDRLVESLAPHRVARYDTDYTARAFGDSMTRWGTSTLLIETGGWTGPNEAERLIRLNFVALAGALGTLAEERLDQVDARAYDHIPLNVREALSTRIVRNLRLASGRGLPPFPADLAFVVPTPFAGDGPRPKIPAVSEVGDLSTARATEILDGEGLLAVPWPAAPTQDWPGLKRTLAVQGLSEVAEATLLRALTAQGERAVAGVGFTGALLLYRAGASGTLRLEGAILHGVAQGAPLRILP